MKYAIVNHIAWRQIS